MLAKWAGGIDSKNEKEFVENIRFELLFDINPGDNENFQSIAKHFPRGWLIIYENSGKREVAPEGQPAAGRLIPNERMEEEEAKSLTVYLGLGYRQIATIAGFLARPSLSNFSICISPHKAISTWDGKETLFILDWQILISAGIEYSKL